MKLPALIILCAFTLNAVTFSKEPDEAPKLTLAQAKAAFEKADIDLNKAWAEIKKTMEPIEFAKLKEEQRDWTEWRDEMALSPARSNVPPDDKEARKSPEFFSASAEITADRALWLRGLMAQSKQPDQTLTGSWSDSYGGGIDLVEKDGKLYFSISVVRGRSASSGELSGIAAWNSVIGWFSDKGRDKEKKDETNLAFIRRNAKLEIVEANAGEYHGVSAFFDGEYVKVGTLNAKKQAEIMQEAKTGGVAK